MAQIRLNKLLYPSKSESAFHGEINVAKAPALGTGLALAGQQAAIPAKAKLTLKASIFAGSILANKSFRKLYPKAPISQFQCH